MGGGGEALGGRCLARLSVLCFPMAGGGCRAGLSLVGVPLTLSPTLCPLLCSCVHVCCRIDCCLGGDGSEPCPEVGVALVFSTCDADNGLSGCWADCVTGCAVRVLKGS